MEITHGRVPVAEEQTEKTHGHVMVTVEQTEETHGPVEIPQGRGCPISCLFTAEFRISKIYFGGDFSGLFPNFEGAAARVSERLLEALEDRHHAYIGSFYDALLCFL